MILVNACEDFLIKAYFKLSRSAFYGGHCLIFLGDWKFHPWVLLHTLE